MKLLHTLALSLAVSLSFTAAPAHADTPSAANIQKFLAFFDKLVDAYVTDKGDCARIAKDMNAVIDANKDVVEMARKEKAAGKTLPPDAIKHLQDGGMKMYNSAPKCMNDPAVHAAFVRSEASGPPPKHH